MMIDGKNDATSRMTRIARATFFTLCLLVAIAANPASSAETKKPAAKSKAAKPEAPPLGPGELPLKARGAIALDVRTGAVLYERNADVMEYPASSTKILTALLIIEAGDLDKIVTVEEADTKVEPSALFIKIGEQYPRKHLLYALLMKSANDAAMALARDNAGSIEAFAEKMNRRAKELGATASHFMNPHGLHHPHHFVTARQPRAKSHTGDEASALSARFVSTQEAWLLEGRRVATHPKNRIESTAGENGGLHRLQGPATRSRAACARQRSITWRRRRSCSVVLHSDKPAHVGRLALGARSGLAKLGVAPSRRGHLLFPARPLRRQLPRLNPTPAPDSDEKK
jgi:D-alanyl-D-alanine carboxypeptidase (penicillin-binding protein 5/6)